MRKLFCAGIALLVAVSVSVSADDKGAQKDGQRDVAYGKVVILDVKDGTGTLTVLARKAKGEQPTEMKFAVTKNTKFTKGAGPGAEATAVTAANMSTTFAKDATVAVRYEGEGNNLTAKSVSAVAPRARPDSK